MPETLEPALKPAQPNIYQAAAASAQSPADLHAERGTQKPAPPTAHGEGMNPDLDAAVRQAQAQDRANKSGARTPEPAAATHAPTEQPRPPGAPPRVPGLPSPTDDYKPRGETAKHWDNLKARHAEEVAKYKADLERINGELSALRTNGSPEVERLKKEHTEYRDLLRDVAIERDPEFKATYAARENAAIDAAKLAAGEKSDKLEALLKAPNSPWKDEQINELLDKMTPSSQRRINAALAVLEQIDVERTSEIARRRATFDQKQSTLMGQQEQQRKEQQAQMTQSFEKTQKEWTANNPFFKKIDGDAAHNAEVDETLALARAIHSGELSPDDIATASFWAAGGPRFLKGWQNAIARAEAAEAKLDKVRGVQPGDGQSGAPGQQIDPNNLPPPGSPEYLRILNAQVRDAQTKDLMAKRGQRV